MKPNLSSPFTLGISVFAAVSALTQTEPQAPDSTEQGLGSSEIRVAERGQDFAVYQRITAVTNTEGFARFRTNEWTLLENGLHFFDAETGDWQPSRDLIESFPEGAIARYGPVRAIFSHDLNSESVFDLETPEGAPPPRGRPRA
ncbi:MAG: hypothetical protein M5U12_37905 [Verrucomicrobia bacterium]|nr:hypothetical protein [Verrucomicrobiota bacterium]